MPYIPYTRDTPLSLNALTVIEGFNSKAAIFQVENVKNNINGIIDYCFEEKPYYIYLNSSNSNY